MHNECSFFRFDFKYVQLSEPDYVRAHQKHIKIFTAFSSQTPNTPPTHKHVRLVETLIIFEDGSLLSVMSDPDPHFVRTLICVISLVMQLQTGKEINHKHAISTLIEWNLLW